MYVGMYVLSDTDIYVGMNAELLILPITIILFGSFPILIDDDVAWGVMGETPPPVLDSKHRAARCFFAVKKRDGKESNLPKNEA